MLLQLVSTLRLRKPWAESLIYKEQDKTTSDRENIMHEVFSLEGPELPFLLCTTSCPPFRPHGSRRFGRATMSTTVSSTCG